MRIFITGGAGYIGTNLTNRLLENGNNVTVCDTFWFGNHIKKNKKLKKIKKNINDLTINDLNGHDAIIHLASIANDPSSDLNPKLSWETIALGTLKICNLAVKCKIKKFIYASSGSVYGIKKELKVTEESELTPLSEYNKCKMVAKKILESFKKKIDLTIIRPATVCGVSDRMRLDVSVNMFAYQAFKNKKITVLGGNQVRPNIHIDDLVDLYVMLLKKKMIGTFNAGFENLSIMNIAKLVKNEFPNTKIIKLKSNDARSYRLYSGKLLNTKFKPKKNVRIAIKELKKLFETKSFKIKDHMFTVKHMVKKGIHR